MSDLLSTAVSALQTYRRGLDATSHNIANVGTEGYSRQRMETATREAQPYGSGWLGSGVQVTGIRRVYDEFVALQARSGSSSLQQQTAFASLAERVNTLYADSSTGLSATLQKFANALQDVATAPSSMSARQVLLSEANALATQMTDYGTRLGQLNDEVNQRLTAAVGEVNSLASAIADLRRSIKSRPDIFELMPELFTLSHLQRACEAVLGEPLDKSAFRRRLKTSTELEPTDEWARGHQRPAQLFRAAKGFAFRAPADPRGDDGE